MLSHDDSDFVKELKLFAENASVKLNDVENLFLLRLISSFAQIKRQTVFSEIVQHKSDATEIDWTNISSMLSGDKYANIQTVERFWLKFLSYVEFTNEPTLSDEMQQYVLKTKKQMSPPLPCAYSPIDAVIASLLKPCEKKPEWDHICKTFLLVNVIQTDPASVITSFFKSKGLSVGVGKQEIGTHVARYLMGFRNSPEECQETLVGLLTTYMSVKATDVRHLLNYERISESTGENSYAA
jgi:hypothetical protein